MARNGASIEGMERHAMMTWEDRYDAVVVAAWERWTKNGLGLDTDDVEQTTKSVRDAATNVWQDGMGDMEWIAATLARLGWEDEA